MSEVGQIGLVTSSGFWSALIRYGTHSTINHSITDVGDVWHKGVFYPDSVVSAEGSGVKLMPKSAFPNAVWSEFDLTPAQQLKIKSFLLNAVDKPYSYLSDILIGIALITHLPVTRWFDRYLISSNHFQCADLCDSAYHAAGIRLFEDVIPSAVYPGMFVPIWVDAGWLPKGTR
jgi:hypothetical protein